MAGACSVWEALTLVLSLLRNINKDYTCVLLLVPCQVLGRLDSMKLPSTSSNCSHMVVQKLNLVSVWILIYFPTISGSYWIETISRTPFFSFTHPIDSPALCQTSTHVLFLA